MLTYTGKGVPDKSLAVQFVFKKIFQVMQKDDKCEAKYWRLLRLILKSLILEDAHCVCVNMERHTGMCWNRQRPLLMLGGEVAEVPRGEGTE